MFYRLCLLFAVASTHCVNCLTCLHCTDIQSPRHCKYVMECRPGEVCNIHQATNAYGDVVFDVGCAHSSACSNRSHGSHSCDECCHTDLCNAAGCGMAGYPSVRGPVCYNCPAQITEGTCHRIDVCGSNEVCMVNEQREFGDTVYISQCVGLTHCERHTMDISQIIGRSLSDDTRSLAETVCHKCCHDDLCNAHCEYVKDCLDLRNFTQASGVYMIQPERAHEIIEVYCDMTTDGGGWTVFQRRVNGSVDFYQNFSSYENGFGNVHGEFWLGLKYIHRMTSNALSELRIDLMAADRSTAYEVFSNFRLSAAPNYALHIDAGHGTAGDNKGMSYTSGYRFTTYDNDDTSQSCATIDHGGWWYKDCAFANLNGKYFTPGESSGETGVTYRDFKNYASLKETQMMFRTFK